MEKNISVVADEATARTCVECAEQRALNLACLDVRTVLELCVGPSLKTLERVYAARGITVIGNDIDPRWKTYYPTGTWLIGDALTLDIREFDAVVFAPPLSRGCTGRREDALRVDEVIPRYRDFIEQHFRTYKGIVTLVLPGRALATRIDRTKTYDLLSRLSGLDFDLVALVAERRITKYYDVYITLTDG